MKVSVAVGVPVVLAAAALGAWIWFNSGMELPSVPGLAKVQSSASASEDTSHDPWWNPPAEVAAAWSRELTTACAAGRDGLQTAHLDVNGDKVIDTVCWQVRRSNIYGDFVEVAAHVVDKDGKALDAYSSISTAPAGYADGSHGEPGLLGVDTITVQLDSLDKTRIGELDTEGHYGRCLRVATDTGDKVWLFWVPAGKTVEERFYFQSPYN